MTEKPRMSTDPAGLKTAVEWAGGEWLMHTTTDKYADLERTGAVCITGTHPHTHRQSFTDTHTGSRHPKSPEIVLLPSRNTRLSQLLHHQESRSADTPVDTRGRCASCLVCRSRSPRQHGPGGHMSTSQHAGQQNAREMCVCVCVDLCVC